MNKNAIIGLVVAVVVIGGGAWYFSTHSAGTPAGGDGAPTGTQAESGTLSFKDLLMMGGSQQCQVTVNTPSAPSTGTVYISAGQVRSDVVAKASGMTINAHMIKDGDTIYSWTDAYPQGVKMKIDASAQSSDSSKGGAYDANAQVQYSCSAWIPDATKFAVPANVTFMDMTSVGAKGAMPIKGGTMPTPPPGTPNNY